MLNKIRSQPGRRGRRNARVSAAGGRPAGQRVDAIQPARDAAGPGLRRPQRERRRGPVPGDLRDDERGQPRRTPHDERLLVGHEPVRGGDPVVTSGANIIVKQTFMPNLGAFFMMAVSADGRLYLHGGGGDVLPNVVGRWVKINTIHDVNAGTHRVYADGVLRTTKTGGQQVAWHDKYGSYRSQSGRGPAVIEWRNIKYFRGGRPPDGSSMPPPPPPADAGVPEARADAATGADGATGADAGTGGTGGAGGHGRRQRWDGRQRRQRRSNWRDRWDRRQRSDQWDRWQRGRRDRRSRRHDRWSRRGCRRVRKGRLVSARRQRRRPWRWQHLSARGRLLPGRSWPARGLVGAGRTGAGRPRPSPSPASPLGRARAARRCSRSRARQAPPWWISCSAWRIGVRTD